jgi:probable phosphoglycerate mutase
MIDLYLIRHAESEMNLNPHLVGGRSNHTPLTGKGREQARMLGERLYRDGITFDAVYSSPAVRAAGTAGIVASHIALPLEKIVMCENLLELDQGEWESLPREQTYTPELLARMGNNNWDFKAPNGESQREVEERMHEWFEKDIKDAYECARVAAFTHGVAIKCFLRGVLDSAPGMTRMIELQNTSITRLSYDAGLWTIKAVNDYAHLLGN